MRILFEIDRKDYENCTKTFSRNSSRCIIIHNHQIAMIHSLKYDYYKFPGGGIEPNESPIDALIRETREEAGLQIQKDSIQEYGCVHRIQKSSFDEKECFIQDNFYYLCNVEEGTVLQNLDKYESDEHYTLEYVEPHTAIEKNRSVRNTPYDPIMFEREARVLEKLIEEKYFEQP